MTVDTADFSWCCKSAGNGGPTLSGVDCKVLLDTYDISEVA